MTDWYLVRLNFGNTPAHFGGVGIGIEGTHERVKSDTLFSAWVSAYAKLFPDLVEDLLKGFTDTNNDLPFCLSSTFLYRRKSDTYIDYLPTPLLRPRGYPKDDLDFAKVYKKLKYLPLSVWQRWYQGEGFTSQDRLQLTAKVTEDLQPKEPLQEAGVFDYSKGFNISQVPKVAVDRIHHASNFFTTGFVRFCSDPDDSSGLYFLMKVEYLAPKLFNSLQAALAFLGEEGLGGERSSGAGQFTADWSEISKNAPEKSCIRQWWKAIDFHSSQLHYSLLSLLWDETVDELITEDARYGLQERGGWIGSAASGRQLRRQMVRMFTEGSVFSKEPQGRLAEVTHPELKQLQKHHPIYRSGVSLSLPIASTSNS